MLKIKLISLLLLIGSHIFIGCSGDSNLSKDTILLGAWRLEKVNEHKPKTKEGIIFSSNKQFFYSDSQGRSIPKLMEKIWAINGDTLQLIDYNWEQKLLYENGTKIFIIEELSSEELKLKMIHPHEDYCLIYKKE